MNSARCGADGELPAPARSRLRLAAPRRADAAEFVAAVHASRSLHRPWIYPPDDAIAFTDYLARLRSASHYGYLARLRETGGLVGVVNINNLVGGVLESASMSFYVFRPYQRQGLMTEAVGRVLTHGFSSLRLHRIEANVQPDNGPSLALVRRLGFVREGYSRRYLKVAGRWRDHERWALLAEDWCRRHDRSKPARRD